MGDKYEYIEYEKLSDAVRDWENGVLIFHSHENEKYKLVPNIVAQFWGHHRYAKRVLKPEPRYETLYECIDGGGNLGLYNEKGRWPNVNIRTFIGVEKILHKTGRTFKLNLDDWSIVSE